MTNGKLIRLLVDDEPFDVRYGAAAPPRAGAGPARRHADAATSSGSRRPAARCGCAATRLVSFTQRAVAAICYEVEALDAPALLVAAVRAGGQRAAAGAVRRRPAGGGRADRRRWCPRSTAATSAGATADPPDPRAGCGWPRRWTTRSTAPTAQDDLRGHQDIGRTTVITRLEARREAADGQVPGLRLVAPALPAGAARPGRAPRWPRPVSPAGTGCSPSSASTWTTSGTAADVEIDGDAELQQAVRFALFHVLQAGARAERRAIAAKGLTGPGYDGHAFWDTETFVPAGAHLHLAPEAAADALRWRQSTLPLAHERAEQLGLEGAAFPWRTIRGQECSGYWPAGTAAFHINADIADAVRRLRGRHRRRRVRARGRPGAAGETARLWRSLGHHDAQGEFRIDGVTGPDEYTAIVRQQRLHQPDGAAEPAGRRGRRGPAPATAARLGVTTRRRWPAGATRRRRWRSRTTSELGVHQQCRGLHRPPGVGLREHRRRARTRCCSTARTSTCTASRWSSRPTWCWPCTCAADAFTAEQKAPQLRLLRGDHRAGLVAVGVHPGGDGRRDRAPGPGLRLPGRGRADGPGRPGRQHRRRPAHRVAGRRLDRGRGRVRRDALRRRPGCRSRPGCPRRCPGWRSGCSGRAGSCASRSPRTRWSTGWSAGLRCGCGTTGSRWRWPRTR